jgi:hypothetical protein
MLVAIPFCVIAAFTISQLMAMVGAHDLAGAAVGITVVREIEPLVTVLVVAWAGSTAMCTDLGARKIREEIDPLEVLGLETVQAQRTSPISTSNPGPPNLHSRRLEQQGTGGLVPRGPRPHIDLFGPQVLGFAPPVVPDLAVFANALRPTPGPLVTPAELLTLADRDHLGDIDELHAWP